MFLIFVCLSLSVCFDVLYCIACCQIHVRISAEKKFFHLKTNYDYNQDECDIQYLQIRNKHGLVCLCLILHILMFATDGFIFWYFQWRRNACLQITVPKSVGWYTAEKKNVHVNKGIFWIRMEGHVKVSNSNESDHIVYNIKWYYNKCSLTIAISFHRKIVVIRF